MKSTLFLIILVLPVLARPQGQVVVNDTVYLQTFVMPDKIEPFYFAYLKSVSHNNDNFLLSYRLWDYTSRGIKVFAAPHELGFHIDTIIVVAWYSVYSRWDPQEKTIRFPISFQAVDSLSNKVDNELDDLLRIHISQAAIYLSGTTEEITAIEVIDILGRTIASSATPVIYRQQKMKGIYFLVVKLQSRSFIRKIFLD